MAASSVLFDRLMRKGDTSTFWAEEKATEMPSIYTEMSSLFMVVPMSKQKSVPQTTTTQKVIHSPLVQANFLNVLQSPLW